MRLFAGQLNLQDGYMQTANGRTATGTDPLAALRPPAGNAASYFRQKMANAASLTVKKPFD